MRICVVSTPVFRLTQTGAAGYSGLEHIAWQCATGLAAKGHTVALVAPDGSEAHGCEVIPCGPEKGIDELSAFQRYQHRLAEYECVLEHSWLKTAYLGKLDGSLKAPVLGVMHAPVHTMYRTWPPQYQGVEPLHGACPVCISQDQANHFEALHGHTARVCHNGVDGDFYQSLGLPRSRRFLFLARFSKVKSPDLAMRVALAAGVGLDLVGDTSITGEPDYLQQCQALARQQSPDWQGPGPQLVIHGGCSRGEAVHWYSQAHAFLHLCPTFREPFGLAPVEAQLCGLPVVAWRLGAVRETVPHGEQSFVEDAPGYLVGSFDEAVLAVKALATATLDASQRQHVRRLALRFSVQRMVDRYEALCQEALTRPW